MATQNGKINLGHHTSPVVLSRHQIYDLFKSDCARVLHQSFGSHCEYCIKQLEFVPSSNLTPVQSSLRMGGGVWGGGGGVGGDVCGGGGVIHHDRD